eukprot:Gregarina_sp_Pseudo_9__5578@NODE_750_length_2271_cov_35_691756_g706_i0_p1_GENE_NODE_750_length_2271_cov_35_691756_g706_i0NODE_750_length_2271_cov_35_691756_g706_i0_p1_ORF_typecomplete_len360_score161_77PfkB/PF00294_24/2_1e48Phos_pyr_kin/PF08543_12/3_4e03Phos_pyr_kin/PF08543_12/0_0026Kelch_4/PF13418_6/0_043TPP_enzyme_N/PF02776_18/0_03TPP_enzyme_N/PF02776_18/5_1e03Kelch_5/PF13854_6/0_29_NODE_750_length_2271_cov_35_691756_g706_i03201399
MSVLNLGSLNHDFVYSVPSLVRPGETVLATRLEKFVGGKGLNQSVALARAGVSVSHVGAVGGDGDDLCEFLQREGVDTRLVSNLGEETRSGHAIIQVSAVSGDNNIVLFGGANQRLDETLVRDALANRGPRFLLTQNETNVASLALETAKAAGLTTVWNPAPAHTATAATLAFVDFLILNESEGRHIAETAGAKDIETPHTTETETPHTAETAGGRETAGGKETETPHTGETETETAGGKETASALETAKQVVRALARLCKPATTIVLTLGAHGSLTKPPSADKETPLELLHVPARAVSRVVDTTAAGDTFVGYFLAGLATEKSLQDSLRLATAAAALTVQRPGAAPSIPKLAELPPLN